MENPINMDDLGGKPTIFGNIHNMEHLLTDSLRLIRFNTASGKLTEIEALQLIENVQQPLLRCAEP